MQPKRVFSDGIIQKHRVAQEIFRGPAPRIVQHTPLRSSSGKKWRQYISLSLIVIIGVVAASWYIARMEVLVEPQSKNTTVDTVVLLARIPSAENTLSFRTVSVSETKTRLLGTASRMQHVERHAEGIVILYNTATQSPQTLVATTRLQAPSGLIYRIPSEVSIPGYRKEGVKTIPGSLEVRVVADKPGVGYNIGLVDFTIPGFKGSPKFETVYARSKSEMTGGFTGEEPVVDEAITENTFREMKAEAESRSRALLLSRLEDGMILIPSSVEYVVQSQKSVLDNATSGEATAVLTGEARGAVVDNEELALILARNDFLGPVHIQNADDLAWNISNYAFDSKQFTARIEGPLVLEMIADIDEIKAEIYKKKASNARSVLTLFPTLSRVEVRFKPFWWRVFPSHENRLFVVPFPKE